MPQPRITKICLKNSCLKFHSNFPGANELMLSSTPHHRFGYNQDCHIFTGLSGIPDVTFYKFSQVSGMGNLLNFKCCKDSSRTQIWVYTHNRHPHISPLWVSYGVPIRCIFQESWPHYKSNALNIVLFPQNNAVHKGLKLRDKMRQICQKKWKFYWNNINHKIM